MRWIIEAWTMQLKTKRRLLPVSLGLLLAAAPAAVAQTELDRTIDQYSCKDVLRESGANREVAVAFLHGFLLGKSGTTKFNLNTLRSQSDQFIDLCLDKSGAKAIDVMSSVKK